MILGYLFSVIAGICGLILFYRAIQEGSSSKEYLRPEEEEEGRLVYEFGAPCPACEEDLGVRVSTHESSSLMHVSLEV